MLKQNVTSNFQLMLRLYKVTNIKCSLFQLLKKNSIIFLSVCLSCVVMVRSAHLHLEAQKMFLLFVLRKSIDQRQSEIIWNLSLLFLIP